jgi:outer membrane protein assembly factor BamB
MYALNAGTGAVLWSYATRASVGGSPAVANGVLYFGSDYVYALNATTGAKLWAYLDTHAVPGTAIVAHGMAYFYGYTKILAFGLTKGAH